MNSKLKVAAGDPVGDCGDGKLGFTLHEDIAMEILPWFPAKSMIRCKTVGKDWLSHLSSDQFCHLHTLLRPKLHPSLLLKMPNSQFFYVDPIKNGEKLMVPYTFSVPNPRILCSCNGLMLLQSDDARLSFHVYNPATKQSRKISVPDTHCDGDEPYVVALALAFDPSKSPHYKVVCIRSTTEAIADPYDEHTYQIEVYDSESRAWNLCLGPFTFPRLLSISHGDGVYLNGSIYWEILYEIGYYDIAKNEFNTLDLPKHPEIRYKGGGTSFASTCLQEADGRLYRSTLVATGDVQVVELFELRVDGDRSSSWRFKHFDVISWHQRTCATSCPHQLRFIKGSYGGAEVCSLVSHMCGKISVFNFLDRSRELLVDLTEQPFYWEDPIGFKLECYEFGECLALV